MSFAEEGRPHLNTPEQRRALKEARVRDGRTHAALVFDGGRCVGWCQFGPTEELPRIKHQKTYRESLGALPDWRITCFFARLTHRHRGVADAALAGALTGIAGPTPCGRSCPLAVRQNESPAAIEAAASRNQYGVRRPALWRRHCPRIEATLTTSHHCPTAADYRDVVE